MDPNRFTEKTQEALQAAQSLAVGNGHQLVNVEHLLRALLSEERGLAVAILRKAGVSTDLFARLDEELERQLTEALRRRSYCVVLFDEIEKAHHDVFNGMLQILDDGRLTDGQGRTVDFKNTILIMTSNIGSQMILGYRGAFDGYEYDRIKEAVLDEVRRFFRPEFLNRVDEIIVFHALSEEHLMRIVDIQLEPLRARLAERQIRVDLTEPARRLLVHIGYDPAYGARPLKCAIQKNIENQFGRLMLAGAIRDGQPVRIDYDRDANRFTFTPEAAPATEPEVVATR